MFGYIVVNQSEMKFKEYDVYRSYYCGLCQSLKERYGVLGQLSLNYDMTFILMLLTGLYEPEDVVGQCRCVAHPFEKHQIRRNLFTDYVADMTVLFACYKAEDDWDKEFFGINDGENILIVKRLRCVNNVPLLIEENHLSAELEGLMNEDLTGSLYAILQEKYHMIPSIKGRRSVKIIFATEEIAQLLKLSVGTPVIESEVCVFDINGGPVHTVKDIVRGDNDNILKWYV